MTPPESLVRMFLELLLAKPDPLVLVVIVCVFALCVVYGCVRVLAPRKKG